jgi:hypothetical protein
VSANERLAVRSLTPKPPALLIYSGGHKGHFPYFRSARQARHNRMVGLVEAMRMTADGLQPTASVGCSGRDPPEPPAVSRKPMALPDARASER